MPNTPEPPDIHLTPDSPTPWVHPQNLTIDMELAAAQRAGGILTTKLERLRNADYDAALREAGVVDPELTGIDVSEESVARVSEVIYRLKVAVAEAAVRDSAGRRRTSPLDGTIA
jgi:hypothetical protein